MRSTILKMNVRRRVPVVVVCLSLTSALLGRAHASYVKTCIWSGTVAAEPKRDEHGAWTFALAVERAARDESGRCDGECESDRGKTKMVRWSGDEAAPRRGQRIWVRYLFEDNKGSGASESYELITATEAAAAMKPR